MSRFTTSTTSSVRPAATSTTRKRGETADLRGRVALLTGGRVKIGYQAGIKLLRAGAEVIVTTRFPRDAATRYAQERDFEEWGERLEIFGLDLRHTPSVEGFCSHLNAGRGRLDFIVNNACQTVRRPPDFYRHMLELETASLHGMPEHVRGLLGDYEGLRRYDMLPSSGARPRVARTGRPDARRAAVPGHAPAGRPLAAEICFPEASSTRTCSRSISGTATPGGCCWRKCARSNSSRRSS